MGESHSHGGMHGGLLNDWFHDDSMMVDDVIHTDIKGGFQLHGATPRWFISWEILIEN